MFSSPTPTALTPQRVQQLLNLLKPVQDNELATAARVAAMQLSNQRTLEGSRTANQRSLIGTQGAVQSALLAQQIAGNQRSQQAGQVYGLDAMRTQADLNLRNQSALLAQQVNAAGAAANRVSRLSTSYLTPAGEAQQKTAALAEKVKQQQLKQLLSGSGGSPGGGSALPTGVSSGSSGGFASTAAALPSSYDPRQLQSDRLAAQERMQAAQIKGQQDLQGQRYQGEKDLVAQRANSEDELRRRAALRALQTFNQARPGGTLALANSGRV